jgi:large subunit ribosomal protein L10
MPTEAKAKTIEKAKRLYEEATGVVFADYSGLSVKELQALRRELKAKGASFHVIKNTLFRIAAGEDAAKLPYELHNGPTAIAFLQGNEPEAAKTLVEFARTNKNLKVKGAFVGGRAFSEEEVVQLSKLPPREVLLAQVIGAIAAPLSQLVGVVEALYAEPIRTIGAVADKVAEGASANA